MARFYSNENIALQLVARLRDLGHDVLTSSDADKANSRVPDSEVLAFATDDNRIVLSHNRRDFVRLHRNRVKPHAGMVLCTLDADFDALATRIHVAVAAAVDIG